MNRKELVEAILKNKEINHLTKKDADLFINTMLETIKKSVKKGDDVSLVGFADYPSLGPSHSELNDKKLMSLFKNIKSYFPKSSNETELAVYKSYRNKGPNFISLKSDNKIGKNWWQYILIV